MDGLVLADIYGSDQTSEHTYESVVHSTSSPPRAPADTIQRQRSQTRSLTNPSVSSFSPLANPQINQMNQQCFDKACRNLKIQLSILVTANLVVLVIFIWNVMYTNAREQNPTVVSSYVKADSLKDNFRLCTKCSALRTSYGGIDDVIRRTRMDENPDVCCFQTISQFLDLFEQYATWYVGINYKQEQCSSDISDDKKLEIISNNRPLMHNWNVKSEGTVDMATLEWRPGLSRIIRFNGSHAVIPLTGYYYVYSNIHLRKQANSIHYLEYTEYTHNGWDEPRKILTGNRFCDEDNHSSSFEGTFKFKQNSTVAVCADAEMLITNDVSNSFGMYLV